MWSRITTRAHLYHHVRSKYLMIDNRSIAQTGIQVRSMGLFSDLKKQFQEEMQKNADLKKSVEDAQKASEQLQKVESSARDALNDASKKTQDASQFVADQISGKVSETSEKFKHLYHDNVQGTVDEASRKAKETYDSVKDESEKIANANESIGYAKKTAADIFDRVQQARRKFIADDAVPRFKKSLREASHELFGSNNRDIDSTLSFRTTSTQTEKPSSKEDDGDKEEKGYTGTSALVAVKEQGSAWDRIGARLKETPIIQGIMDAARQAAETQAGQTIGKGAKKAKDKIGDVTEDAREFWETSQNPWVYRLSSLYDGFFGETEMAIAIREIRRADPSFILEQWKDDVEEIVIPAVLDAFLTGDSIKLKKWFGEAAYNTVNHAIRERKTEGLVVDPNILAIRNVEVIAAKAEDKQAPLIVLQFMAQQINCITNREGDIVEGAEDEVRAVYYALAFQRDYDEDKGVLQWKIVEMAMLGDVPYV